METRHQGLTSSPAMSLRLAFMKPRRSLRRADRTDDCQPRTVKDASEASQQTHRANGARGAHDRDRAPPGRPAGRGGAVGRRGKLDAAEVHPQRGAPSLLPAHISIRLSPLPPAAAAIIDAANTVGNTATPGIADGIAVGCPRGGHAPCQMEGGGQRG